MVIHIVLAVGLGHIGRSSLAAISRKLAGKVAENLLACIGIKVGILNGLNLATNIDDIVLVLLIGNSWIKYQWNKAMVVHLSSSIQLQIPQYIVYRLAGIEVYILAAIDIACQIQLVVPGNGILAGSTNTAYSTGIFGHSLVADLFLVIGCNGNIAVAV